MEASIDQLKEQIDLLRIGCQFYPIHKGFSNEKKYLVLTESGERLLLRVMSIEQFDRKKTEFDIIGRMYSANVKVPKPIAIGKWALSRSS